jgi:hypothetical protein
MIVKTTDMPPPVAQANLLVDFIRNSGYEYKSEKTGTIHCHGDTEHTEEAKQQDPSTFSVTSVSFE